MLRIMLYNLSARRQSVFKRCHVTLQFIGNERQFSNRPEPINIAYSVYDSAPTSSRAPVIIMHGLLGSKQNWHSLSKIINTKTHRKVIAVDARNHGESPHSPDMTYNHLVQDLLEFVKKLDLKEVAMIGHSMGGRAMMLFALNYPELVEKLIVVDMSPIGSSPNFGLIPQFLSLMNKMKFEGNVGLSAARKMANEELKTIVQGKAVRQFFLTNLVNEGSGVKWRVNIEALLNNFGEVASFPETNKVFAGSTYFIGGGNSDYLSKEDEPAIRKLFTTAKFDYIPGAGHWVHSERPNEFLELACKFLMQK